MALPTITLNNQTASAINLTQLAVLVPASGSETVSDFNLTDEILNDEQLQTELTAGNLTVTYNGITLTVAQSQAKILPQQALDILHNLSAIIDPTATDDEDAGYSAGSFWVNTVTRRSFQLINAAASAAIWRSAAGNSPILAWGNRAVGGTTTTRYMDPWGDLGDVAPTNGTTNARIVATRNGTIRNLYVRQGNPDGNGNDITYTVRVNGAPTAVTVTMASTDSQASDTTNSVAVSEGDNIDIEVTKAASVGNSPDAVTAQVLFT